MNIVIIVLGVIAASFGEIKFVMSGFLCQMGGIFFEAYRLATNSKTPVFERAEDGSVSVTILLCSNMWDHDRSGLDSGGTK